MDRETVRRGAVARDGGTANSGPSRSGTRGSGPGALREDLLYLLRSPEVRQRMNEALLREATGESKSTGVIRAYELVQKILQEAGEDAPPEHLDLRRFSDRELRNMMARIRRGLGADGRKETDGDAVTDSGPEKDGGTVESDSGPEKDGGTVESDSGPEKDGGTAESDSSTAAGGGGTGKGGGDGHGQPGAP